MDFIVYVQIRRGKLLRINEITYLFTLGLIMYVQLLETWVNQERLLHGK